MKSQFKLDDRILLELLLKQTRIDRKRHIGNVVKQFNLKSAKLVDTVRITNAKKLPGTDQPMYTDYQIWDTGNHLVKTTIYGRVVDIEMKARSVVTPKVIIKKRRTITKPQ
jgi:hypothetical protein